MALYTLTSKNDFARLNRLPGADQTQLYNAIGRDSGAEASQGAGDNFFTKKARSIENAFGTTGAAIASAFKSGIGGLGGPGGGGTENIATAQLLSDVKSSMNDIAKKYGYNSWSDWQDAWYAAKEAGDTAKVAEMEPQLKEFQAQADINAGKANEKAAAYKDYMDNNYVSQKINQDRGKFAGSAINTLSTAADITGLSSTPVSNAIQGGVEGIADELEQNGLENFDWGRAGQNALVGAATGAVTGKLNKGINNALAKRALAKGATNTVAKGGLVQGVKDLGKAVVGGAARGAVSGAVGGATGAGLSSALNRVDLGQGIQNTLQGAVQGAQQGAITGGIMGGANYTLSKTPGVGDFYNELQSVKKNWDESGSNFKERRNNTLNSGDSAFGNWLNRRDQSKILGSAGNLGNSVQDVSSQTTGLDAWDRLAQQNGYNNYDEVIQRYLEANPDVELNPRGAAGQILTWLDQNPNTPTTAMEWVKRAGQRIVEDANDRGVGLSVKDISQDLPDDIRDMKINDYNENLDESSNTTWGEKLKANLRNSNGRAASTLKNMPGTLGDKYNDWIAEPAEIEEFGPRYSQFSGDPEAAMDYLMRRQQGEVPKAGYNQSLQDLNGDGFIDYVYGKSGEGDEYNGGYGLAHIQAKHGDEALSRVPYNIENGVAKEQPFGRYYLTNDSNDDLTVVKDSWKPDQNGSTIKKQWLATSYEQDNPVSRGTVNSDSSTARTSAGSGEIDTPANRIITQNGKNVNQETPETELWRTLNKGTAEADDAAVIQEADVVPSKTTKEAKMKYAQGKELLAQYGAVDQPMARATNAVETLQEIADMGFTKPADVEKISNAITGANGAVSTLNKNIIKSAQPVDTFSGDGEHGQTLDDYINYSIEKNKLSGTNKGVAIKRTINAYLKSLPSRADGSIDYTDSAADTFKVIQGLEKSAAESEGRGGSTYHRPTQSDINQANVMKDVANLLKNRMYDGADVKSALTPDVAKSLKSFDPNNEKWANTVDNFVANAKTPQDLRTFQKPFVRASRYIDNQYVQAATVGGRMASNAGELPSVLPVTKAGWIKQAVNDVWNSNAAHRARANLYGKMADNAANKTANTTVNTTATPTTTNAVQTTNPAMNVYNAIGRTEGLNNAEQARTAGYITDATQNLNAESGYMEPLGVSTVTPATTTAGTTTRSSTSVYDALAGTSTPTTTGQTAQATSYFPTTGDYWTDVLGRALTSAINNDDVTAFASLYGMYQDAISNNSSSSNKDYSNPVNWNSTDRSKLISAQNALDQIDQLESAYNAATGGEGSNNIQGWLRSRAADISGGNWDPSAANYNSLSESVGMAIIKNLINLGVTEADAERYKKYIPSLTDTKEQAATKLETLRSIYQNQINNLYSTYGA